MTTTTPTPGPEACESDTSYACTMINYEQSLRRGRGLREPRQPSIDEKVLVDGDQDTGFTLRVIFEMGSDSLSSEDKEAIRNAVRTEGGGSD
ncbi:MAG: hypothetical protein ACOCXT_02830 [Candidatus Dojkabacteria bacterium]